MQAVADAANALGTLMAKEFDPANAAGNPAARRSLSFVMKSSHVVIPTTLISGTSPTSPEPNILRMPTPPPK